MNFTDEQIKSGKVIMYYGELDKQVIADVDEYNDRMSSCRIKMKYLKEVELGFFVINTLAALTLFGVNFVNALKHNELNFLLPAIIIFVIFMVVFCIFGLSKKNYIVCTAATLMLCVLDLRFLILTAADIVLTLMQRNIEKKVKNENGYPHFMDLKIEYEHRPRYDDDGNLLKTP